MSDRVSQHGKDGQAMNDQKVVDLLKGLVIDGVDAAASGHPGGAMSSMDFAYTLFSKHLRFDPEDPDWLGRDRFILSAGHESMLIYSLLYANGWLEEKDLRQFRQYHSKTPGHPENFLTPGVECTTGPLGQGAAMSVGFAIGAAHLASKVDEALFDYKTWVLLGDGCMQEGVTYGAASLAGHLGLSNLVWYYDKNSKQISGDISRATSDDEVSIFKGLGWNVIEADGHDRAQLDQAIQTARGESSAPTLIVGTTIMAQGAASVEGQHGTHGAPLAKDELAATKAKFGIPEGESFYFPKEAFDHYRQAFADKQKASADWKQRVRESLETDESFKKAYLGYFEAVRAERLPEISWDIDSPLATRNAFGKIIEGWADALPNLIGGSADLEPSNMTGAFAKKVGDFHREDRRGRNLVFGVREFPMSAICNGLALHGGFVPFDATFLSFADYSRPALRLGAIQKVRVIHEFTHDSFYLGEDGPTHQPVEHVMSLRAMPDFYVIRPCDARETEALMRVAVDSNLPSAVCLTRQKVPFLDVEPSAYENAAKGAWVVKDSPNAEVIVFATGSEVTLALKAAALLGDKVRVVSVPCWELFDKQAQSYRDQVLDWSISKRVSIEAGSTLGWQKFVGHDGLTIGLDHYGASAPAGVLEKQYGFTPDAVAAKISEIL